MKHDIIETDFVLVKLPSMSGTSWFHVSCASLLEHKDFIVLSTGRHNLCSALCTSRGAHVSSASCELARTSASGRITGARRVDPRIVVERLR